MQSGSRAVSTAPRSQSVTPSPPPEFEQLYAELQKSYLDRVDRQANALLGEAIRALARMLKHSDWRARDQAVQHVLKLNNRFVEHVNVTGQVAHLHHSQLGLVPMDDLSESERDLARQLLTSIRARQTTKALPPRLTSTTDDDHHARS